MRVVMIEPSPRGRHEHGAVAILVAILATVLMVLSAMVVDFGLAYTNKRQAQVSSDAAALAAAKVFKETGLTCAQLQTAGKLGPLAGDALTAANSVREANLPGATGSGTAACDGDNLVVTYTTDFDSPLGLGKLASADDSVGVSREAVATFGRAQLAVGSLRPWGICGTQVPAGPYPSKVVEIGLPGNGHVPTGGCTTNTAGDWWRMSCFNGGGSHGDTEQNVLVGCDNVQIVPGQPVSATPSTLSSYLKSKCSKSTGESVYCLGPDSGRDVKTLGVAWSTLLGKTISMPIFCDVPVPASSTAPNSGCSPTSVDDKKAWPIWRIAAVTVCGYYLKTTKPSNTPVTPKLTDDMPDGECEDLNTDNRSVADFEKDEIGFLLIFQGIIGAGLPSTFQESESTMRLTK